MGSAKLIDGNVIAAKVLDEVSVQAAEFRSSRGRGPGLAVVLVGEDPASSVYVRMKIRDCGKCGIESFSHKRPAETTTEELLKLVEDLNRDDAVDGLLVQLPLPDHIDTRMILDNIDPAKDVDGFNPRNVGRLVRGDEEVLAPCTPAGVMRMLDEWSVDPKGRNAVVVGRSDIVGKPMALMLLHRHATVTICHSRTRDLADVCRTADILVAAVGRPLMIGRDWIREGAVVIDVGMNSLGREDAPPVILEDPARMADFEKKNYTLVGDVSPDADQVASLITPVPGGVGPMTRALLMANTLKAANWRKA
jgi:methylenetetrahydrofolate dehydrogenase (NADP+)/methenyltetrahydrofolate cyclohydrolase